MNIFGFLLQLAGLFFFMIGAGYEISYLIEMYNWNVPPEFIELLKQIKYVVEEMLLAKFSAKPTTAFGGVMTGLVMGWIGCITMLIGGCFRKKN